MRCVRWPLIVVFTAMVVCGGGLSAQEGAPSQYLGGTAILWNAPDDAAPKAGKVLVATPVQVLSQSGDWVEITMGGWTQEGAERVIYAAPGMRILRAAVAKGALDGLEFSQVVEDSDTDLIWTRTTVHGWLKQPMLHATLQEVWDRAEPLFAERCTACHQRRVAEHYTANQWSSHLKVMGPRTGLPKEDQFLIRAYLQHHAQDAARLSGQN